MSSPAPNPLQCFRCPTITTNFCLLDPTSVFPDCHYGCGPGKPAKTCEYRTSNGVLISDPPHSRHCAENAGDFSCPSHQHCDVTSCTNLSDGDAQCDYTCPTKTLTCEYGIHDGPSRRHCVSNPKPSGRGGMAARRGLRRQVAHEPRTPAEHVNMMKFRARHDEQADVQWPEERDGTLNGLD